MPAPLSDFVARQQRIAALDLRLSEDLPITAAAAEILDLLRSQSVIIVCGETGSGKSTQLPKLCLQAGLGVRGMIGHTQPRRLAARSIASRLAEELGSPLGTDVGFKIRFSDQTRKETLIKLMTDGMLLAETQKDRQLRTYEAIIIDEAHERSLNIDFLLGYCKRLLDRRSDLKLIITSATIDAERFANHFASPQGPAPIVNVQGRSYGVEIRYRPWDDLAPPSDLDGLPPPYDLARHCGAAIDELMAAGEGDILIFLPTERDIRDLSHRLAGHLRRGGRGNHVELLPLYARLPQGEQHRIFHPSGQSRRIILATNVAESSLTVPGIRYVIDTGTARISRYSPRSKVQRLPIEPISQASARQRAGRCGRVAPGICIRLYSESDFLSRDPYTTPEIRRTNLASVILQTKVLRLGPIDEFPFLDPPRPESIREGYRTLFEIGALDDHRQLTEIGHRLGRMPVDPRVGRIILAADAEGVLPEILVIAGALEIQDPRERPAEKKQAADQAQAIFQDPQSDFLAWLKLWKFSQQQREKLSRAQLEKALRSRFLSPAAIREWGEIVRQLRDVACETLSLSTHAFPQPRLEADWEDPLQACVSAERYQAIHRALLTGLLSGAAMRGEQHQYEGAGGLKLFLWPGSGIFKQSPKWIVAAELVETTRQYARCVARIEPQWLEQLGSHLVRRNYSDSHWSDKRGAAMCYEQVSLFGLRIVTRRPVALAPIDPGTARQLLIEHGLVEHRLTTRAPSIAHNARLENLFTDLAAKTRRRDFVVDPYQVIAFYQQRLPASVVDRASLEQYDRALPPPPWSRVLQSSEDLVRWLEHPPANIPPTGAPLSLWMRPEDLHGQEQASIAADAFPDAIEIGATKLPLEYHFAPGTPGDGLTLTIPQSALPQISDQRLGWLVPGLLEEKVTALIKALPKRIRRNLVPAAETAKAVIAQLPAGYLQRPFFPTLCQLLAARAEMPITENDFEIDKIPPHLQFRIRVIDDRGTVLAEDRSVQGLRQHLGIDATKSPRHGLGADESTASASDPLDRDQLTSFDLPPLSVQVIRNRGGVDIALYPALIDRGEDVSLRLLADERAAQRASQQGLMRLYAIAERKELRSQVRWLPQLEQSRVLLSKAIGPEKFEAQLIDLMARRAFVDHQPMVRTSEEFQARRAGRGSRIAIAAQEIATWLPALAQGVHRATLLLESSSSANPTPALRDAQRDIERQIAELLAENFLQLVPWEWLQHYPRYFRGIEYRLDKLRSGSAARDADSAKTIGHVTALWKTYAQRDDADPQIAQEVRWWIEELRVSLFAQPLGTAVKVSPQRIEKQLAS